MTEKEKMTAGKIYDPSDEELVKLRTKAYRLSKEYNELLETDEKRSEILKEMGIIGDSFYLQGPVQFDYGCLTSIGANRMRTLTLRVWIAVRLQLVQMYLWDQMCHFLPRCIRSAGRIATNIRNRMEHLPIRNTPDRLPLAITAGSQEMLQSVVVLRSARAV